MSKAKAKGTGYENEVTNYLNEHVLLVAERVGKIIGNPGDVEVSVEFGVHPLRARLQTYVIECKRRASAWKQIYKWLDKNDNDFLFMRADHEKSLVVMRPEQFVKLLSGTLPASRKDRRCFDKS